MVYGRMGIIEPLLAEGRQAALPLNSSNLQMAKSVEEEGTPTRREGGRKVVIDANVLAPQTRFRTKMGWFTRFCTLHWCDTSMRNGRVCWAWDIGTSMYI